MHDRLPTQPEGSQPQRGTRANFILALTAAMVEAGCTRSAPPTNKVYVSPSNPDSWGVLDLKQQPKPYELTLAQLEKLQYPSIGLNRLFIYQPPGSDLLGIASFFKPEVVRVGTTGEIMTQRGRVGLQSLANPFKPDIAFAETIATTRGSDLSKLMFKTEFERILEARLAQSLTASVNRIDVVNSPGSGQRRAIVFGRNPTSHLAISFNFQ